MSDTSGVPQEFFQGAYEGAPPWEIGRAQGDVVRLADRNEFKGAVLDIGCGTGENALFLASRGLAVTGIDAVGAAIEKARAKAAARNLNVTFEVANVLTAKLGKTFETVLDSGLFHTLSDAERTKYIKAVAKLTKKGGKLHILCFSDLEPGTEGPRRVREQELLDVINLKGWLIEEIQEARFETTMHREGARAWLATFTRTGK